MVSADPQVTKRVQYRVRCALKGSLCDRVEISASSAEITDDPQITVNLNPLPCAPCLMSLQEEHKPFTLPQRDLPIPSHPDLPQPGGDIPPPQFRLLTILEE